MPVYTWRVPGLWYDIGSKETLEEANRIFARLAGGVIGITGSAAQPRSANVLLPEFANPVAQPGGALEFLLINGPAQLMLQLLQLRQGPVLLDLRLELAQGRQDRSRSNLNVSSSRSSRDSMFRMASRVTLEASS